MNLINALAFALTLTAAATPHGARAQDGKEPATGQSTRPLSVADLDYQVKYQRAFEAAAWAMPAVGIYKIRSAAFKDFGLRDNSIATGPWTAGPAQEILTANSSTPYILGFTDISKGPAVLELPPATDAGSLYGQVVDHWQATIADVGPSGMDAGKGGKYLFVRSDYQGEIPEGYIVVKSPSNRISMVFRSVRAEGKTDEDAYEYSKKLRLYYLADGPGEQHFVNGAGRTFSTLPDYSADYFQDVHDIFTYEDIPDADRYMMGMLQSLGIEKGKPFAPDAVTRRAMENAMGDLFLYNQQTWDRLADARRMWPDRQYTSLMMPDANRTFSYDYGSYIDIDTRLAQWATATVLPRKLSDRPATDYLMALKDSDGNWLEAEQSYKVTVPADMPVRQFWALTVYDHATFAFIYNDLDRTTLSMYDKDKMAMNADGSVTLYVGPKPPEGLETNWIPTAGKRPIPTFRFYAPTEAVYDGSFRMPDFEKIH